MIDKLYFLSLVLLGLSTNTFGQSIGLSGGINYNIFYDLQNSSQHFSTNYSYKPGYTAKIGFDPISIDDFTIKFLLQIENIRGNFYTSAGGLGYNNSSHGAINNTYLGLGVFPFNFIIFNKLHINLGTLIHYKVSDHSRYEKTNWVLSPNGIIQSSRYDVNFTRSWILGANAVVALPIKMTKTFLLSPYLQIHHSLSSYFKYLETNVHTFQFESGIELKKNITE